MKTTKQYGMKQEGGKALRTAFKFRVQTWLRETIEHRRYLIRNQMSRPNEIAVAQRLNNLAYWNDRLLNDRAAANLIKNRFEYIKSILPKYPNQPEPHGIDKLRELHTESLQMLQPQQLSIF